MDYEQCIAVIDGRQRFRTKPTLDRITRLLWQLGDPQMSLRCVHITGTNGKGSVCAMTSSVLQKAGFKTGLFTSPYLIDFRERFQINGTMISKEDLCRWTQAVLQAQQDLESQGFDPINSFEMITAIGLCWFAEQRCDYVVLEVGLGGRFDPTNVIPPPAAACITAISLDHTEQLGSTAAQIAKEKAGIIKQSGAVITPTTQAADALTVIRQAAAQAGADCVEAALPSVLLSDDHGTILESNGLRVHVPLLGEHQVENAACVIAICRRLGIEESVIADGIEACRWPGRLQLIRGRWDTLIDAAHNPGGISALCRALDSLFPDRPLSVIMGMMRDKSYAECMNQVAGRAVRFYSVPVDSPRSLTAAEAAETASEVCRQVVACASLPQAIAQACALIEPNGLLLICGSVYLAGEAVQYFSQQTP